MVVYCVSVYYVVTIAAKKFLYPGHSTQLDQRQSPIDHVITPQATTAGRQSGRIGNVYNITTVIHCGIYNITIIIHCGVFFIYLFTSHSCVIIGVVSFCYYNNLVLLSSTMTIQ